MTDLDEATAPPRRQNMTIERVWVSRERARLDLHFNIDPLRGDVRDTHLQTRGGEPFVAHICDFDRGEVVVPLGLSREAALRRLRAVRAPVSQSVLVAACCLVCLYWPHATSRPIGLWSSDTRAVSQNDRYSHHAATRRDSTGRSNPVGPYSTATTATPSRVSDADHRAAAPRGPLHGSVRFRGSAGVRCRRLPRDSAEAVMVGRGRLRVVSAELPARNRPTAFTSRWWLAARSRGFLPSWCGRK